MDKPPLSAAMNESGARQRRRVHFGGHVQGVGFRYTVERIAAGFEIGGYVQNLADGRVRLVAEGSPVELDRFFDEVRTQLAAYIRDVQSETTSFTGEFDDFQIRY